MKRFEFATANQILFGPGVLADAAKIAAGWGRLPLMCLGVPEAFAANLLADLRFHGLEATLYPVDGEPTIESVARGVELARQNACDMLIGLGGGSAMDTAKAIAAFMTNPGNLLDYLEVIGQGKPISNAPLPVMAIPTTAGTGAEVTRNAVIGSPAHGVKVSLRSPLMLPRLALVDPTLTYGLPPALTASTGLDALTQLIEPFVSVRANPITDSFCREGVTRAARSLRRAFESDDHTAREEMALASLLGGLALANAGLGVVHGFAGVLGGLLSSSPIGGFPMGESWGGGLGAPHGALCAALLPHVMYANLRALQERQPESPALPRFDELAGMLVGRGAAAADGIAWVRELCRALNIPGLAVFGLRVEHSPEVVEKTLKASSTKANPIPLSAQELTTILKQAL